jgi:hypothetical protein
MISLCQMAIVHQKGALSPKIAKLNVTVIQRSSLPPIEADRYLPGYTATSRLKDTILTTGRQQKAYLVPTAPPVAVGAVEGAKDHDSCACVLASKPGLLALARGSGNYPTSEDAGMHGNNYQLGPP